MKRNFVSQYIKKLNAGVDTYFWEEVLAATAVVLSFIAVVYSVLYMLGVVK